ncbi:MAG: pilus assembly protein PilP [Nitrospira sp.]|nr:pilus assembly protein PilP [Nitrospira sp.]
MTMGRVWLLLIWIGGAGAAGTIQDRAMAQPASTPTSPSVLAGSAPAPAPTGGAAAEPVVPVGRGGYVYLPEGRRDPFLSILREAGAGAEGGKKTDEMNVPPLQRVSVAELTVIGIVWGGFGYMAMVQTPDGKGYAVQRGTRIGNNNGIVSAITEKAVIVEERFTDIYGKKQVREYAKPLHVKESLP